MKGQKFGRLTVMGEVVSRNGRQYVLCECECGTVREFRVDQIKSGNTKSCGCWSREVAIRKAKTMGKNNRKHGMSRSRLYHIWSIMKDRCDNPHSKDYPRYGGRGISYDPRWKNFEEFLKDMGPTYKEGLTLDRIDCNGNYTPSNCRWATVAEQNRNRRSTIKLEYNGEVHTLWEWSQITGLLANALKQRLYAGWTVEEILFTPYNRRRPSLKKGG